MGNGSDKKKQEELRQREQQNNTLFLQHLAQSNKPTPLQEAWEKANLNFLNWENQEGDFKDKPIDVRNAPGLGPALSLFDYAKAGQQGERQGIGLLRMGIQGANPNLTANLAEQSKLRREQDAAGNLERNVAVRSSEAHGSVLPLASLTQNRNLTLAGLTGSAAGNSLNTWAQFRPQPSFWGQLALNAAQGAGQGAAMLAGGGGGFA